jgi:hypothetical protein
VACFSVETYGKHFIGLVKNEHLHGVGLQEPALDHILNTTWGTNNNLGALLKSLHIITDASTTNASVALDVHEVANGDDDLLDLLSQLTGWGEDQSLALLNVGVELLEDGDGESGSLSGTRLSLCNNIVALELLAIATGSWEISKSLPLMTGMIARCWIADGRSKP